MIRTGATITMSIKEYDKLEEREAELDKLKDSLEKERYKLYQDKAKNIVYIVEYYAEHYLIPRKERYVPRDKALKEYKDKVDADLVKFKEDFAESKEIEYSARIEEIKQMSVKEFKQWRKK